MLLKYLLEPALKKCKSYKIIKSQLILDTWDTSVGEKISKISTAVSFKNGILFVEVSTSSWLYELTMLKPDILKKLNGALNKNTIKDIRFSVAKIQNKAAQGKFGVSSDNLPVENISLDVKEMQEIENTIKEIKDEKLRNITKNILIQEKKNNVLKKQMGYKSCSTCGVLIKNKEGTCHFCDTTKFNKEEEEILKILTGKPWSTYGEVKKLVPDISKQKYDLIKINLQEKYYHKIIPLNKKKKLNSGELNILLNLVMLKTELPPEKLNYDICQKIIGASLCEHLREIFGD